MARGNERRRIYRDATDRREFLRQLELAVERYEWLCHGYCLMPNHYHLLVETPRANLPIGMRHLNGCYGGAFNRRHDRVGHVFQGRYNAQLVEKQSYLIALVRYIMLNPIRTAPPLSSVPEGYRWSSYRILLGLAPRPHWLTTDWILVQFGDDYESARSRLREYVARDPHGPAPPAVGEIYVAGEEFVRRRTAGLERIPEIPRPHWQPLRPGLEEIFATAERPILTAYRQYGFTLREIGEHLGCHYNTVSRRLRAAEAVREWET
jgi:REP element-mobilizing transposase RayT